MNIYLFQKILGIGMFFFQILIVGLIFYFIYKKSTKKEFKKIETIFNTHGIFLVFLLSLFSLIISIIFSNYYHIEPCELCWFQRVCIYPQIIISAVALLRKKTTEKNTWLSLFILSIIGFILSSYQTLEQFRISIMPQVQCVIGPDAACSQINMLEFGYITFPFSSAMLFLFIIMLYLLQYKK